MRTAGVEAQGPDGSCTEGSCGLAVDALSFRTLTHTVKVGEGGLVPRVLPYIVIRARSAEDARLILSEDISGAMKYTPKEQNTSRNGGRIVYNILERMFLTKRNSIVRPLAGPAEKARDSLSYWGDFSYTFRPHHRPRIDDLADCWSELGEDAEAGYVQSSLKERSFA